MCNRSPIHNMLEKEIRACAENLLEIRQNSNISIEEEGKHAIKKLHELHQFAMKIRENARYHSLGQLRHYLENRMVPYVDEQNTAHSMRLSEAIFLLGQPREIEFNLTTANSLLNHFSSFFRKEIKPGRPLFKKLEEIKKI